MSARRVKTKAKSKATTTRVAESGGAGAPAPKPAEVRITPAKGRPMLVWVGKRPLREVVAYPAQHVETYAASNGGEKPKLDWSGWPRSYPQGGLLFHGDNKEVLAHLLANGFRGKVNLIYIDPPFDSGADYVRKVSLRGATGAAKIEGESYTLGEQIQYTDIWANDNYLQYMYERLLLLRELLSESGNIYVHADYRRSGHFRLLLDEVFGPDAFFAEIAWLFAPSLGSSKARALGYGVQHHTLLVYGRGTPFFSKERAYLRYTNAYVKSKFTEDDADGRGPYRLQVLATYSEKTFQRLRDENRIVQSPDSKYPYYKQYLSESIGVPLGTAWEGIYAVGPGSSEREDYPTQKPELLLERIISVSSRPGDLVLDSFVGSGTTAAVAQKLGRRWIGCDINKGAIQTTAMRLQTIIADQATGRSQHDLGVDQTAAPVPAQLSFTTWRVNDYDLQIQHNEAVNLAVELLGVERTRVDGFFDGTLGKALVKIAPFTHPLTPLDLEDIRRELDARPDEDRPITVVCLGIETAAQAWVEEWNALRKGAAAVNKITVIELRTDPTYGKFIRHEPARARVKIERKKDKIIVVIEDFISPTIIERLHQQAGVLSPKIDDWRAMVDCVMIDTSFDGQVFNVAMSDVPERKQDFVRGSYELPAPSGKTSVAVKIVDMLGEEVLELRDC